MKLLQSWMFVPGHRQNMIEKALGLDLDAAILDLEDGVPPDQKQAARAAIAQILARPSPGPRRWVRVHAAGQKELSQDLDALFASPPDGLVLSKVEGPQDVLRVEEEWARREMQAKKSSPPILLVAGIESPAGLLRAPEIVAASPRMAGLLFGAEDFARNLGLWSVQGGARNEMLYARSALAIAAASRNLQAIDRVFLDLKDAEGLRQDALQGRELGFTGKALIHPGQIEVVHEVFRPTAAEVLFARRVVEAFEQAATGGAGAVSVDGQMVDLPVVERARRLLALGAQKRTPSRN